MSLTKVIDLILDATKAGPVSQWVDRIAAIADKAGLDLCNICWQDAPITVVLNVYQEAERQGKIQKLIDAVNKP